MTEDFDKIYPIGSIFISFINQHPPIGEWTLIESGCYLKTSTNNAGQIENSASHTHTISGHSLTTSEMPSHSHTFYGPYSLNGNPNGARDTDASRSDGRYWRNRVGGSWSWVISTGSGTAHGAGNTNSAVIEPPYITIFMYRRLN